MLTRESCNKLLCLAHNKEPVERLIIKINLCKQWNDYYLSVGVSGSQMNASE